MVLPALLGVGRVDLVQVVGPPVAQLLGGGAHHVLLVHLCAARHKVAHTGEDLSVGGRGIGGRSTAGRDVSVLFRGCMRKCACAAGHSKIRSVDEAARVGRGPSGGQQARRMSFPGAAPTRHPLETLRALGPAHLLWAAHVGQRGIGLAAQLLQLGHYQLQAQAPMVIMNKRSKGIVPAECTNTWLED